jgi:hypothetical protein
MRARSSCGRWVVDDDDEIERLLAGYDLPRVEDHCEDDAILARLDDGYEWGN